jgi:hypothetical protein
MKAILQRRYGAPGDVLRLGEIDKPAIEDARGKVVITV